MIFERVKEVILASLNCDEERLVITANLKEDLEMDSLDAADLAMALEDEFDITLDDSEFENLITVEDIVDYIENNK